MNKSEQLQKHSLSETWVKRLLLLLVAVLAGTAVLTAWLDPFFHYHKPVEGFYYELSNERAQNDGIVKQFAYDALITGTSFTQNFKTSEMDERFDCHAVKVSFSGATQKEMADIMETALSMHEVRYVVASASDVTNSFIHDKDYVQDAFDYPAYLYNRNPFDDVKYLLNRDVLVQYVLPMLGRKLAGRSGGVTSFDDYSNWTATKTVRGREAMGNLSGFDNNTKQPSLTADEAGMVRENVQQNLVRIVSDHPDTMFYLFFPPYSIAAWGTFYGDGMALKYIEAEQIAIEMLAVCPNVRLFTFGEDTDLVCDFNNYADRTHFTEEINSLILEEMAADNPKYRITRENAKAHIEQMKELYLHYDYESLADGD